MKNIWTNTVSFFKKIWNVIAKIATWIASVLEDQGTTGSISSKRVALLGAMYYLWTMVQGMLNGKIIDNAVLWVVASIILFNIGAITSEFFTMFGNSGFGKNNTADPNKKN